MCTRDPFDYVTSAGAGAEVTVSDTEARKTDRLPHVVLADMLSQEIGALVDARLLRLLLLAEWPRIARLAHAIHDTVEKPDG